MKRNNKKNQNEYYSALFFSKDGYDVFVENMMKAAEEGNLPMAFRHEQPEDLSINDIRAFANGFRKDTGLDIEFQLFTCNHCDKLHCCMVVDNVHENEMED